MIAFILTMPQVNSWNHKWSGEENLYAKVHTLGKKEDNVVGYYRYSWSDGWGAAVEARRVTAVEARKMRKASKGFCGYDWMIDSIIRHGKILDSTQEKAAQEAAKP